MRLLRIQLILPLVLGIALVSVLSAYYEVRIEMRDQRKALERRAEILGESVVGNVETLLQQGTPRKLESMVQRFAKREHLAGIVICDASGNLLTESSAIARQFVTCPSNVKLAMASKQGVGTYSRRGGVLLHIYALPVHYEDAQIAGGVAIVHDGSYIEQSGREMWRQTLLRVLLEALIIMVVTLLILHWSITRPVARAAQWMHALRTGRATSHPDVSDWDFFRPLAREVATFAESLKQARSAAETEAQLREKGQSLWTPERLAVHVRNRLRGSRLFVVANREPYMHRRKGKAIEMIVPASGLVTAIEPVLRTCDGTWVAHGAGDADTETVDKHDRLPVPPDDPRYTLRRVWLSKEEEEGYYYGFANEGLWPLCHIAHTRPTFRASDWKHYVNVNQKFADAVLEEMSRVEAPVLLAQDYHFALLPRMIKEKRPDVPVAIFWHIPWPNPEVFGICPMQRELLDGLLGADLIGFHIQLHCNQFMQTVDRALESVVDWEHFSVKRRDHNTLVRPYPISVETSETRGAALHLAGADTASVERNALLKELGVDALYLGVGVDRVDYTKGILERLHSVERFLEKYPSYQGKFTFIQIGAPSRLHIKRYHELFAEVESEAERINWRFQADRWKPIVFLKRQHSHQELQRFYRAADVCMVTSLHDGMNLVSKEFLVARDDEQGMLVLSCFTGAARELTDALLVNPYDIDQMAQTIHFALEMSSTERRARMQRMRKVVQEHNVYWWAGNLIADLCAVRVMQPEQLNRQDVRRASVAS